VEEEGALSKEGDTAGKDGRDIRDGRDLDSTTAEQ
jgi:hypothetical protein